MLKILHSLPQFTRAIENNEEVECNKKGEWKVPSVPTRIVKQIVNKKGKESKVLEVFHKILSQVEYSKLYFGASQEVMDNQRFFYQSIIQAGQSLIRRYSLSESAKVKQQCNSLELSIIKMQYRIQMENGGLKVLNPDEVDEHLVAQLQNKIEEWKRGDEKYQYIEPQNYTAKIREICRYSELTYYLLNPKNRKECHEYLDRSIRDNFSIQVLNQFYYESINLDKNWLASRIGAIARDLITVDLTPTEEGFQLKTLNLLMENNKVNLLDKNQRVRFSNGLVWTLPRIYRDFREKYNPGELEIMWDGIIPFNSHEMGPQIIKQQNIFLKRFFKKTKTYRSVDSTKPRWFEKTPWLDIRSKEYIEERYKIQVLPDQWVTVLEATRQNELDVIKSHGYSLFYQPIGGNQYRVYTFGAFPLLFPQNFLQLASFIGNTVKATITTDPNYYYSRSQKVSQAIPCSEEVATAILKKLGLLRKSQFWFQFPWENCAYLMRNVFNSVFKKMNVPVVIPNYFEKKFLHMKPKGPLLVVQKIFKKAKKQLLPVIKVVLAAVFRATRTRLVLEKGKIVKKSLWRSPFFTQLRVNVPSSWHHRIKKDRIAKANNPNYQEKFPGCVLNYGHHSSAAPAA